MRVADYTCYKCSGKSWSLPKADRTTFCKNKNTEVMFPFCGSFIYARKRQWLCRRSILGCCKSLVCSILKTIDTKVVRKMLCHLGGVLYTSKWNT